MVARAVIAAVAVAALVWLALGLRSLDQVERAERIGGSPEPAAAEVEEAERLLESAQLLNPDVRPLVSEGSLLVAHGGPRSREGLALLERAVEREPENPFAWAVLASATRDLDPERSRQARARIRELSPPVPEE